MWFCVGSLTLICSTDTVQHTLMSLLKASVIELFDSLQSQTDDNGLRENKSTGAKEGDEVKCPERKTPSFYFTLCDGTAPYLYSNRQVESHRKCVIEICASSFPERFGRSLNTIHLRIRKSSMKLHHAERFIKCVPHGSPSGSL